MTVYKTVDSDGKNHYFAIKIEKGIWKLYEGSHFIGEVKKVRFLEEGKPMELMILSDKTNTIEKFEGGIIVPINPPSSNS